MKEEMTMKKMITNMKALAAMLMVGAAVTSCSSDDSIIGEPDAPQVYTMTVEASKGTNGTRTLALADGGTTLTSTWSAGDKVEVWTADGTTKKYGELTAQTAGASTTLRGTLSSRPSDGEKLTLKYLSPSYDTQDGTLTGSANSIDQVCDYATATVKATVNGSSVTTSDASFVNQQAVVKFTLKNKADNSDLNATAFAVTADGNTYTVTPTSATSELYVAVPAISAKEVSLTAIVGSALYTYTNASVTFANGNFYRITVKMSETNVVPGKFTVNSGGNKVQFAKGNLRCVSNDSGSSWSWSFFDTQDGYYDTYSANAWDKFGWVGKSVDLKNSTPAKWGVSTSKTSDDYGTNLSDVLASDWGNVPGIGSGWSTLSHAEWGYLFNTREVNGGTGAGHSYTLGQSVNGKLGVVIYPDNYTGTLYTTGANWSTFEAAGCVFLPAAGSRSGSSVTQFSSLGYYWSSTSAGIYNAYFVYFNNNSLYTNNVERSNGYSVRLVRQVK